VDQLEEVKETKKTQKIILEDVIKIYNRGRYISTSFLTISVHFEFLQIGKIHYGIFLKLSKQSYHIIK